MNQDIFVEQLSADGEVRQRAKINHLPIRIGRAYDNDIILDDPHTAPHHAQIVLNDNNELIISDLETLNGITFRTESHPSFVIHGDHVYRLGHTHLRVRTADYPVAAEISDSTNHHWEGWQPAIIGVVLIILTGLFETWLNDLTESTSSKYLTSLLSLVGFGLGWSGLWALVNKLFAGRARFGRHVFIAGVGIAVLECWDQLSGLLGYALNWSLIAKFSVHPLLYIFAAILYFHLRTTGNKRLARVKLSLACLAVLGSAIIMTKHYQATNHLSDELYLSTLYPPAVRISPNHGLDEFMQDIETLKVQVDSNRKENKED